MLRPSTYSNGATFSQRARPKPECQSHGGDRLILKVEPEAELKHSTNIKGGKKEAIRERNASNEGEGKKRSKVKYEVREVKDSPRRSLSPPPPRLSDEALI